MCITLHNLCGPPWGPGGGGGTPLPARPGFFRLSATTSGLVFIFYTSLSIWHLDAFSFIFVL